MRGGEGRGQGLRTYSKFSTEISSALYRLRDSAGSPVSEVNRARFGDSSSREFRRLEGARVRIWLATIALSCLCLPLLSGCGLYAPRKDLFHDNGFEANGGTRQGNIESNIIANIRCEVIKGLFEAEATQQVPWIRQWGTSVALNLTWDEQSNVSPGLTYTTPLNVSEMFTVGAGVSASAHSTRQENITFTWDNKTLLEEGKLNYRKPGLDCSDLADGVTVNSDLKIDEFILDKATIASDRNASNLDIKYPEFSVFQETLTFVVSFNANGTPTWKLTRFTVPNGTLIGAGLSNTSVVIVTLGKLAKPATAAGAPELIEQARIQQEAATIGAATATSIVGQTPR